MDKTAALRILQTLIEYFETGNNETDRAAKNIIEWDFEYLADWQVEIKRLNEAGEWAGLRAPEADIIVSALRTVQRELKSRRNFLQDSGPGRVQAPDRQGE